MKILTFFFLILASFSHAEERYAWANSPRYNLYHREGLPAVPFRSNVK
jgi:hypothetical protein